MAVLEIKHLSKSFRSLSVLKDISFKVEKGEVISIIGPSGSGKSTLLRCAVTLEKLDTGSIIYDDLALCTDGVYGTSAVQKEVRKRFGLVFQNFNLFPHYSVLQNITDAPVSVLGRNKKEVTEEALLLLHKMGLDGRGDAYPCQLSGGQQQRVAIARALALKPDILFFDEPTSALDPELTAEILKVIRKLAEEHMTMVIVTHEIDFAKNVSDRVIFMADGMVIEEGPPAELIDAPKCERTKAFLARLGQRA